MLLVLLACLLSIAAGYPIADNESPPQQYTILYDGPDGRHVQTGEPGRRVSGYFTSRSLDGLMEYRTDYVADENGYRPVGEHLPHSRPIAALRSHDAATPYVINYDLNGQSHYQMGEPGKAVEGSFMFTDAEGRSHQVRYIADEKGYRIKSVDDVSVADTQEAAVPEKSAEQDPVAVDVDAEQPAKVSEEPAPVEDVVYSTFVRDSPEMPDVPAAAVAVQPEADDAKVAAGESDAKPVEEPLQQSTDALEPGADYSDANLKAEPKEEHQMVKLDEEPKEEPAKVEDELKTVPEADSTQTEKVTYAEVNENKKEAEEQQVDLLRSLYEQYAAAQRSKFDAGSLKDEKHLLFNYPFYASQYYAPASFYAQQRKYPFAGYYSSPYQYPGHLPFQFNYHHQYPYRFFPYY